MSLFERVMTFHALYCDAAVSGKSVGINSVRLHQTVKYEISDANIEDQIGSAV
jgi:hypothetical protein